MATRILHTSFVALIAVSAVLALYTRPALAGANDTASLRREVQALQREVADLKARITVLERAVAAGAPQQPSAAPASAPPQAGAVPPPTAAPPQGPEIRHRWREIKHGMTQAQITQLLGNPTRTLTLNNQPVWYYHYMGVGSGSVVFTDDGHVSSWQNPPLGPWW
ncbi:MAG: outer membrane protein assembly factor BamE [Gammaproteobacteria bacterium]|nr:outer membrane protein assembly factor BamE [Gammaproteobacteria bacterium]